MRKDADWFDVDDVGENWRHENSKTHKKICSNFELTEWDIFIHSVWTVFDVVCKKFKKLAAATATTAQTSHKWKKTHEEKARLTAVWYSDVCIAFSLLL